MSDSYPTQPYAVARPELPLETIDPPPGRTVKVGHLVVGLVFLGLAGAWALGAGGALGGLAIGLAIPVVLVAAGVIGLLALVLGNRRRPVGGGLGTGRRPSSTDADASTDVFTDHDIDNTDHDTMTDTKEQ